MRRHGYDMGSKWMLHHQGKGALLVGGMKNVRCLEGMPGEIVQNRNLPDGLLRVCLHGERKPHLALVEIATYPEKRALRQALDDLALAYSALGHLPELLMLHPKGSFRISGKNEVQSKLGLSRLEAEWKVVELWTLPAAEFLAVGDVGVVPWVPLMRYEGRPETLLERCAEKIERDAPRKDKADLLAVSQVMTELRFPDPELLSFFGGQLAMIESPLLRRMMAETIHKVTHALLKRRFGTVPREVTKLLRGILDERKLTAPTVLAGTCPEMESFREALLA